MDGAADIIELHTSEFEIVNGQFVETEKFLEDAYIREIRPACEWLLRNKKHSRMEEMRIILDMSECEEVRVALISLLKAILGIKTKKRLPLDPSKDYGGIGT